MDKDELVNTVIAFANKMSFPWKISSFKNYFEEQIVGLYVYSNDCDPEISDPIMYWEWYADDWSECDGYF